MKRHLWSLNTSLGIGCPRLGLSSSLTRLHKSLSPPLLKPEFPVAVSVAYISYFAPSMIFTTRSPFACLNLLVYDRSTFPLPKRPVPWLKCDDHFSPRLCRRDSINSACLNGLHALLPQLNLSLLCHRECSLTPCLIPHQRVLTMSLSTSTCFQCRKSFSSTRHLIFLLLHRLPSSPMRS